MSRAVLLALAFAATGPLAAAANATAAAAETGPAVAPAGPAAAPERVTAVRHDDGRRTMGRLPANLGRSLIGVWNTDNLTPFLAGGVATSASSFFDKDTQQAATNQLGWSDTFETAGGPVYSTVFVAGMFTAGRFANNPRFRAMTYDMLDAAVVNFTYTEILKVAVGRERPNGQDNKSFPSGHTSNAFAMASVAQLHYGWKIGVPAYALAGLMGASRIHQDSLPIASFVQLPPAGPAGSRLPSWARPGIGISSRWFPVIRSRWIWMGSCRAFSFSRLSPVSFSLGAMGAQ